MASADEPPAPESEVSVSLTLNGSEVTRTVEAGTLLSTFRLTEDQLRQERPLHANKEVPLSEIRRMLIGGRTVEIYASPGPKPDLEFDRKLQGGDELIEKLAGRLPEGAEIEHPSGELAGRLGGRA